MRKRKHLSIEGGTLSGKGNGDATNPTPHIEDNQRVASTSLWVVGAVSIDNQGGRRGGQGRDKYVMFRNKRASIGLGTGLVINTETAGKGKGSYSEGVRGIVGVIGVRALSERVQRGDVGSESGR